MEADAISIGERIQVLSWCLILLLIFGGLVWRLALYEIKTAHFIPPPAVTLSDLLGAFAVFLSVELIAVPALAYFWLSYQAGEWYRQSIMHFDTVAQGWFNIIALVGSTLSIFLYCLSIKPRTRSLIFWGNREPATRERGFRSLLCGAATWIVSYPSVVLISQVVALILLVYGPLTHADQTAIKHVKSTMNHPPLFLATIIAIIFFVPVAEEILFRGFLQRWAVQSFGRLGGIVFTSALFALFHFSSSQGIDNIELLLSLFVLSIYLGFVYEKLGCLWATVGLHMTFNTLSLLILIYQELGKQHV